jgi:hypothetical protein
MQPEGIVKKTKLIPVAKRCIPPVLYVHDPRQRCTRRQVVCEGQKAANRTLISTALQLVLASCDVCHDESRTWHPAQLARRGLQGTPISARPCQTQSIADIDADAITIARGIIMMIHKYNALMLPSVMK